MDEVLGYSVTIGVIVLIASLVIISKTSNHSGSKAIGFGWIFTLAGGIGAIISRFIYLEAEEEYERVKYASWWYRSEYESSMEISQIAMYVYIAFAVLGVLLLIVGYVSKTSEESHERQQRIVNAIVNSHEVTAGDTQTATDGSWVCNCGKRNTPASNYCGKCGKKKPIPVQQSASSSSAEKIKELKELLDSGLITQEEFDTKRQEVLDKM